MKQYIKTLLFAVVALLLTNSAWGATLPAGTYYFDFTDAGETVSQVQIDQIDVSNITFDDSNPLNTGITRSSGNNFSKSGITYLVITIGTSVTKGSDQNFLQYYYGSGWRGWFKWSDANLTDLGTNEYYCKVTSSGFAWQTSGPLPTTTPTMTYTAGDHGSILTHTQGGVDFSSGATIDVGTAINLVATPDLHYAFLGWRDASGNIVSTSANFIFSMPSYSLSYTAVFYLDSTDPIISGCEGCFRVAP